jgi:predicted ATPase
MPTTSAFVGRERELTLLRGMLDAACGGTGGVALLAGEPGIGKTRTAEELAASARQRDAQVLWGRCYEGDPGTPGQSGAPVYWPWVQAIRAYVRGAHPTDLAAAMGSGAAVIAQVVPDVGDRLAGLTPPPPLEPAAERFRLFDSITAFLIHATRARPLVLILDDLHWADVASHLLLQFLAREMRASRLLVLGTCRDSEVHPAHPLTRTLVELGREPVTARFSLRGLGEADLALMIESLAGAPPPASLVATLHRATAGNPFFATEAVRFMLAEDRFPRCDGDAVPPLIIPPSVRDALGQRLGRLSAACSRVLKIAAVLGRELDLSTLGQVRELAGERLLEALEEAETAHLVTAVPGAPGRYRFMHALIRETLYEELPTTRRIRFHREVGEALERLWGADVEAHLTELAHRFHQAAVRPWRATSALPVQRPGRRCRRFRSIGLVVCAVPAPDSHIYAMLGG